MESKACVHCGTIFWRHQSPTNFSKKRFCRLQCSKEQRKAVSPEGRFWPKVQKGPGCWLWTAVVNSDGYGHFRPIPSGKEVYAHRFSYELHNGAIPPGMSVMHTCDNPRCVNPAHLRTGTHAENMLDKHLKDRLASKLTIAEVREIKRRLSTEKRRGIQAQLAREFNISETMIGSIKAGKQWKFVQ